MRDRIASLVSLIATLILALTALAPEARSGSCQVSPGVWVPCTTPAEAAEDAARARALEAILQEQSQREQTQAAIGAQERDTRWSGCNNVRIALINAGHPPGEADEAFKQCLTEASSEPGTGGVQHVPSPSESSSNETGLSGEGTLGESCTSLAARIEAQGMKDYADQIRAYCAEKEKKTTAAPKGSPSVVPAAKQ